MGSFYVNFSVKTSNLDQVLASLQGRRAVVTRPVSGWVLVADEIADTQFEPVIEELGQSLSHGLATDVFAIVNHDDDILVYWLYRDGNKVDEYNSRPGYFEGNPNAAPLGWRAEMLCSAFASDSVEGVEKILRAPGDYTFAFEQHSALMAAVGGPSISVGFGYGYASQGELPKGLDAAQITLVQPKLH